jgi:hypothetical protein
LKKTLLILSIILSIAITSQGQKTPIARFYPNPAINEINFDLPIGQSYNLQVYSFLGRKMTEITSVSNKTTINLSDYTRGVYVYKLFDRTGQMIESGKFQVSK